MLEFVISYELSVHFSYYGQKNNIKIKDYKFIKIILGKYEKCNIDLFYPNYSLYKLIKYLYLNNLIKLFTPL